MRYLCALLLAGCSSTTTTIIEEFEDAGPAHDAGVYQDAASLPDVVDASVHDVSAHDTSAIDTSVADTYIQDTSLPDTNVADTSVADTSHPDTSVVDAGPPPTVVNCGTTPEWNVIYTMTCVEGIQIQSDSTVETMEWQDVQFGAWTGCPNPCSTNPPFGCKVIFKNGTYTEGACVP